MRCAPHHSMPFRTSRKKVATFWVMAAKKRILHAPYQQTTRRANLEIPESFFLQDQECIFESRQPKCDSTEAGLLPHCNQMSGSPTIDCHGAQIGLHGPDRNLHRKAHVWAHHCPKVELARHPGLKDFPRQSHNPPTNLKLHWLNKFVLLSLLPIALTSHFPNFPW